MIPPATLQQARWIWTDEIRTNSYVLAVKTLELETEPQEASLQLTADTKYKLYLNGHFVNAGPCPFRKPVVWLDDYDVTDFLVRGTNTIAIIAHFIGTTTKYNTAEQPGILAELTLNYSDLETQIEGTDSTWQVASLQCWANPTPQKNWALEHVEEVDLAHHDFGFLATYASDDYTCENPSISPESLAAPRVFERPDLIYRKRMVPNLRWTREDLSRPQQIFRGNTEIYSLQDTAVRLDHEYAHPAWDEQAYEITCKGKADFERNTGEPGYLFLYDFGRICAGDPAVEIVCEQPCTLDFALAENLTSNGRPIIWRCGTLYFARYHLQAGVNRLRFYHFNGYRYLYLSFKDATGRVEINRVSTHHCRADLEFDDQFQCGDRTAEALYRISRRSLKTNTQALPYDCNSREQGAYWGDNLWIADNVGHLCGNFSHLRQLCYAATDEYEKHGAFIPANLYGLSPILYDYCLIPPQCLWRYYLATGDDETVADNLETTRGILAAFRKLKDDHGLLALSKLPSDLNPDAQRLLFLDHPGLGWHPRTTVGMDRRDTNAGLNLFYLQALQALAGLEQTQGKDTIELEREIDHLRQALLQRCFSPQHGLLADAGGPDIETPSFSQLVNCLAVMTGVIEGAAADHALRLVMDVSRHPWISQGTPYSYFFLAEAAALRRLGDMALRTFTHEFTPMLQRGATTTWEGWHAENHDSLNHAWSSPFPHLVRRALLGLEPQSPGYHTTRLCPQLDAMDTLSASCRIPAGKVSVRWNRVASSQYDFQLEVPEEIETELVLPDRSELIAGNWQGVITLPSS